ncbi:PhnA domain-containing protein [Lewinella cohaerens]|uniref:PhnA domain-containing protein n=1 Tax=Lewinella cohaerens TaxID=70995 RepID=UPI0003798C14|nr:alkylphosphonate utilization protein [Lewinella cohaerens]
MSTQKELIARSGDKCELCGSSENLDSYTVAPRSGDLVADCVYACSTCRTQLENPEQVEPNHWRSLNDSMWSEVPAVQVVAYRMLHQLRAEGWPAELLEMMYLDEDTLAWAKEGIEDENAIKHIDSNGNVLEAGDSVVLIQDLKVKGANFTAKRGTAVRRISLVHDNPEHIEGKVDGQHIVILTKYVKKSK